MKKANVIGRIVVVIVTVPLIGLLNFYFKGGKQVSTWMDLYWPLESWWFACFVVGIVVGEAVRRWIDRGEKRP